MQHFMLTTALVLSLSGAQAAFAQDTNTTEAPAEAVTEEVVSYAANTVLATVNGTELTLGHLVALASRLPENYRQIPTEVLFPGLIDQLIDQTLLANKAEAAGGMDRTDVRVALENERRGLLANITVADVIDTAATEDAIQAAYDAAVSEMTRTNEFNASHILVETEEEANALVAQLTEGADFAELAQEFSTGPSGPNGGELGWFGPGQMVPEFDAAVQSMDVDTVSAPVQTQFGWHVVKLNETRLSPLPPIEQLRPEIVSQLNQDALQAEIEALRGDAEITMPETEIPASAMMNVDLNAE